MEALVEPAADHGAAADVRRDALAGLITRVREGDGVDCAACVLWLTSCVVLRLSEPRTTAYVDSKTHLSYFHGYRARTLSGLSP